ncbi:capping protein, Arp2/3 and myosin-I linker protein 3 isoform X3 [Numida meleagris]|uniref:capping protein, Arp2/3 and myosin-I linker protein 3 isoform X3 n=1 Tax=Numida meleagris TaxID=8996 RepID=UPI000B3E0DD3|nr:capping protein, Arp2/3 and myosin-I linker protein 3 isoform X3 [Numida meleagris]
MAPPAGDVSRELQESIRRALGRPRIHLLLRARLETKPRRLEERILALTAWRLHLFGPTAPAKAEGSLSVLEIRCISATSPTQVRLDTERGPLALALATPAAAACLARELGAALGRALPCAPPVWTLPPAPPLDTSPTSESSASSGPSVCGGFSDTYAALCDYNGLSCREEVQWDVDTLYHAGERRCFDLRDFSHLESRELALAVAALGYNRWFRGLCCRDLRLSSEVQAQVLHAVRRSPALEELILDNVGLNTDFASRLATALAAHPDPPLRCLELPRGPLGDKGLAALSQRFLGLPGGLRRLRLPHCSLGARGLAALGRALGTNPAFRSALQLLDLGHNPGLLGSPHGADLFAFLAQPNALLHLDLASTDCALDVLFGALLHGCCSRLSYLNVAGNSFCHRKTREVPPTLQQFFCSTFALSHISLAGVRLPPDALRSLLQGLAANTHLSDLHLDLSGCELRSPGARVLEELLGGISAVGSLDLSDNGFDADLLTLVPALGRNKALKHLWLGKNFSVKARTLEEILHKLVQVIQEDDCSLQSLSVAESRLKARTCILVNALGSNACLAKVDLSGNFMEDMGAKMLAKALQINSTLRWVGGFTGGSGVVPPPRCHLWSHGRSLIWDRNNTTAVGFQDIARAMESNHTLTFMALPLCDLTAAYRSAPERTDTGWQQTSRFPSSRSSGASYAMAAAPRYHQSRCCGCSGALSPARPSNCQGGCQGCCQGDVLQMLCRLSGRVQAAARGLRGHPGAQRDLAEAQELLREARNARALFPSLAALGPAGAGAGPLQLLLQGVAGDVAKAVDKELEVLLEALLGRAAELCPRATAAGVWPGGAWLGGAPRPRPPLPPGLAPGALLERAGEEIREQLGEVQLALVTSLTQAVVAELLRELRRVHQALAQHLQDPRSPQGQEPSNSTDEELGIDVDAPTLQRHRRCCRRTRPPSAFMGQSEGLESPSPPRSSEGDAKPHPLHFRAPEAQAVGGSPQEEGFGRLPPTVPPYPQEHGCSPGLEESATPEAGSPGVEWAGLPSPQTPPPQAPPRLGAWPLQSCSNEGGGGAIPEAPPTAPTGEGFPRRWNSGRGWWGSRVVLGCWRGSGVFLKRCGMLEASLAGTSDRSRQLPPPKPQRRQRAHSCDKADAGPGPGGGGEAAEVL